jgi:hypothetical protein
MKKTIIILALIGFLVFGGLCIKNVIAYSARVESLKFDKDPKKANDLKVVEFKDTTMTNSEINHADLKVSTSSVSELSVASQGCSDKDKAGCCSSSPDKK